MGSIFDKLANNRSVLAARLAKISNTPPPPVSQPLDATEQMLLSIWRKVSKSEVTMLSDISAYINSNMIQQVNSELGTHGYNRFEADFFEIFPCVYQQSYALKQLGDEYHPSYMWLQKLPDKLENKHVPKLVLCHPACISAAVYQSLADRLSEVEVLALEPDILYSDISDNFMQRCNKYLQVINQNISADVPLILAGWSHGGLLALQMAHLCKGLRDIIEVICLDSFISCDTNSGCFKHPYTQPDNPSHCKDLYQHLLQEPRAYRKKLFQSMAQEQEWGRDFIVPKLDCSVRIINFSRAPNYLHAELVQNCPNVEFYELDLEHDGILYPDGLEMCLASLSGSALGQFIHERKST